jgi:poly(3-hydroxybutyrate) depolymerase
MPGDEPQKAIQHDLMVNVAEKYKAAYTTRKYYTNLPSNYDHTKPYPMIFYGQGCGQTGPESGPFSGGHFASEVMYIQLIPAAVTGDTVVPSNGAPGCFQAGKQGLADSPDGPYFDQVLAEVEAKYCVDTSKVYVAGWSSGAWLSNYLACARGNVITGTAAGSGGLQHDHGTCTGGGVKAMILDGDAGSIMEGGFDIGAASARDTLVAAAGGSAKVSSKLGPDTCDVYAGNGPVAWCPVGGGHGGPLNSIAEAAWAFWNAP